MLIVQSTTNNSLVDCLDDINQSVFFAWKKPSDIEQQLNLDLRDKNAATKIFI